MSAKANTIEFWVHRDPQTDGMPTQYWTSHTEPIFDNKKNGYVISDIGHRLGDKPIFLNLTTKALLPPDMCSQIKPGMKARVTLEGFYELKDSDNKTVEPIRDILRDNDSKDLAIRQFNDGLVFGKKGEAKIYTRTAVVLSKQVNDIYPIKAEYMNELGEVVARGGEGSIQDYYQILGYPGDVISPRLVGNLWGDDYVTYEGLDSLLVQAYRHGLRFEEAPEGNEVVIDAVLLPTGEIELRSSSPFYGFGTVVIVDPKKSYKADDKSNIRSIDRTIVNAMIAYRWFFNKPELKVVINGERHICADDPSLWKTKKEYNSFHRKTDTFVNKTIYKLSKLINDKIEERWKKRIARSSHFDPSKLRFACKT